MDINSADGRKSGIRDEHEALFASLRQQFSDTQLVELASACAWENYRALPLSRYLSRASAIRP